MRFLNFFPDELHRYTWEKKREKKGEKKSTQLRGILQMGKKRFLKILISRKKKKMHISIFKKDLQKYLADGWIKGRKIKFK